MTKRTSHRLTRSSLRPQSLKSKGGFRHTSLELSVGNLRIERMMESLDLRHNYEFSALFICERRVSHSLALQARVLGFSLCC